jgi:hypothetical protein
MPPNSTAPEDQDRKRRSPGTITKVAEILRISATAVHSTLKRPNGPKKIATRLHALASELQGRVDAMRQLAEQFDNEGEAT